MGHTVVILCDFFMPALTIKLEIIELRIAFECN